MAGKTENNTTNVVFLKAAQLFTTGSAGVKIRIVR
jgi:hypothetical protein